MRQTARTVVGLALAVVLVKLVAPLILGGACACRPPPQLVAKATTADVPKHLVTNASASAVREEPLLRSVLREAATDGDEFGIVNPTEAELERVQKALNHLPNVPGDRAGAYVRYNGVVYRVYLRYLD